MIQKIFLTTILLTLFFGINMNAQKFPQNTTVKVEEAEVEVTHAKFVGKTRKLSDLVPMNLSPNIKRANNKKIRKKEVANFIGRRGVRPEPVNPWAITPDPDPIRQTVNDVSRGPDFLIEPIINMNGINAGGSPSDPTGDVGQNFYMQAVNATAFRIYNKDGSPATNAISANTLWNDIGFSSAGDPIILYDQEMSRWIITEFPPGNQLLFAISVTDDPTGSYNVYNFSTPNFPDYPKYAVWNNSYVCTTNEQGGGVLPAYFINRQEILDGAPAPTIQRLQLPGFPGAPGFFVGTPVDWSGMTAPPMDMNPMVLRISDNAWGGSANDQIDVFSIDVDWANPNNTQVTTTSVELSAFDTDACASPGPNFGCIPQMNGAGIDGLPDIPMFQPHYRNFGTHESLVFDFLVNANTPADIIAGIRWVELRKTPGADWTLYQEGTYSPDDGLHRFNAGIAMDASGNIGMAYNVSSPTSFPGLRFTGRFASDPLGEMTVIEYNLVEGGSANGSGRWGDYPHMTIDPTDDRTFWFTSEYRTTTATRTRIATFRLERDTTDIGVVALNTPVSGSLLSTNETVDITIRNFGLDTQMVFNAGYIFENGTEVVEAINMQLLPDSTITHTFTPTVDMSTVGNYDFKLFTSLVDDSAIHNDTFRVVVSNQPRWDAGITNIIGLDGVNCSDPIPSELVLTNFGSETLTTATISITINGAVQTPISWTGSLAMGETENIPYDVSNLLNGANDITASASMPNGMTDEIMTNDATTRSFDAILDGVDISLIINLDNFAQETTWELATLNGDVVFSGGPYPGQNNSQVIETWCLDPDDCYEFTIFDSYGDGICCGYGFGSYSIVDADGLDLFASTGEFGTSETNEFCATFACSLSGDIDISNETAAGAGDGALMITAVNGVGPFMYSIDGGVTFSSTNVFNGLSGGTFNIVIMDVAECLYEETVEVATCAIEISATVVNETVSGNADGSITISSTGGQGTIQYSTNGVIFGSNNMFTNLPMGDYTVFARDESGCQASITVTVDINVSTGDLTFGTAVEVLPNPTNGVFRINVIGLNRADVFLPIILYDASGKFIYQSQLAKYDDTYTSQVSLVSFPSGTYFVRLLDENIDRLVKVVKN